MWSVEEFYAVCELVFDKINTLLNFYVNPAIPVPKLQNANTKRCFDHRTLAFGAQENIIMLKVVQNFKKKKNKASKIT